MLNENLRYRWPVRMLDMPSCDFHRCPVFGGIYMCMAKRMGNHPARQSQQCKQAAETPFHLLAHRVLCPRWTGPRGRFGEPRGVESGENLCCYTKFRGWGSPAGCRASHVSVPCPWGGKGHLRGMEKVISGFPAPSRLKVTVFGGGGDVLVVFLCWPFRS